MVKIVKRPKPPRPIKSESDYRSDPNFTALRDDCYGKCYLCEMGNLTNINVEHRVPHRGNPSLKYDWNNLFLTCGHCNNTKGNNFDNILDPSNDDPEDHIALALNTDELIENVEVVLLSDNARAIQTMCLLGDIYNGKKTVIKALESSNLRNMVSDCISNFLQYIKGYQEEPDLGYEDLIKKEISRSSTFSAFKRKIVRDDVELSAKFHEALM